MTSRQVSKDQHRLKEKIENERIEKKAIESEERRENEEKEKEVEKKGRKIYLSMIVLLQFVMSFYRNKMIGMLMQYINFHV